MEFTRIMSLKDSKKLISWLKRNSFVLGELDEILFMTAKRKCYKKKLTKNKQGEKRSIAVTLEKNETYGLICLDRGDSKESKTSTFTSLYDFHFGYKEILEEYYDE